MARLNSSSERPVRTARILVVDDVADNRDLLTRRLQREGYSDIATAEDGEEALTQIAARPFDLVLLDVMMPKCDGYQVLERLRADGKLHELPVIVISALNEMDSVVRCIQLGAVDYLSKPFNATLLRARVHACLEQKGLRDIVKAHLERLEGELDAARKLQMSMVPTIFPPPTPERPVEIFAAMIPAREVGGDLYDFFFADDGRLVFAVGDVSGKGVPAAMFMARTKNLLRVVTGLLQKDGVSASPADIVGRINKELCEDNDTMMFVTAVFGILDPKTGAVELCNAGHDAPLKLSTDSIGEIKGAQGMALGINPMWRYETVHGELASGETLFVYTDGVTEAADADNAMFTRARLDAVLQEFSTTPLQAMIGSVAEAVRSFAGAAPQFDDITALAVRRV
jgi:sigma-B regulation protein RsbU (phosphoserine phosphatase)